MRMSPHLLGEGTALLVVVLAPLVPHPVQSEVACLGGVAEAVVVVLHAGVETDGGVVLLGPSAGITAVIAVQGWREVDRLNDRREGRCPCGSRTTCWSISRPMRYVLGRSVGAPRNCRPSIGKCPLRRSGVREARRHSSYSAVMSGMSLSPMTAA